MRTRLLPCVVAALWIVSAQFAVAVSPTPAEFAEARQWVAATFENGPESKASRPFFSFTYDGKPSAELLGTWKLKRASRPLDDQRTEHTLTYTDPKTGLELRCVGVEFRDFPAVEWTLHFKNTGEQGHADLVGHSDPGRAIWTRRRRRMRPEPQQWRCQQA